jgi:predicted component of type VI protein secretion system
MGMRTENSGSLESGGHVWLRVVSGPAETAALVLRDEGPRGAIGVGSGTDCALRVPSESLPALAASLMVAAGTPFVRSEGTAMVLVDGERIGRAWCAAQRGSCVQIGELKLEVGLAGRQKHAESRSAAAQSANPGWAPSYGFTTGPVAAPSAGYSRPSAAYLVDHVHSPPARLQQRMLLAWAGLGLCLAYAAWLTLLD